MSASTPWQVLLVGGRADLAARPFEAEWGHVRVATPAGPSGSESDLTIVLDPGVDVSGLASARKAVWHPAPPLANGDVTVVARPWPVADDLFDMPPSSASDSCLVIGPEADRERIGRRLTERGRQVRVAPGATRELLAEARIVVSLTECPPPEAFGILAAGRVLVAAAGNPTYGLQPWIDHMPFANDGDIIGVVDALVVHPAAWEQLRALGRQSAEPHRASTAVGRLVRRIQAGTS